MPRSRQDLKLHEYVAELRAVAMQVLADELGIEPQRADRVAMAIVRGVCQRNAKSVVYIPEASSLDRAVRNAVIWAEYQENGRVPPFTKAFTAARVDELAAKHDLTPQMVYAILRDQRAGEIAERQAELPL
jgi:Mor family transcriptional regulator